MKKSISILMSLMLVLSAISTVRAAPAKAKQRGIVQELNLEKQTFTLKAEKQAWKVLFSLDTIFINDGEKAEAGDLKNDLMVVVSGTMSEDKTLITAQVIAWTSEREKPGPGDPGRGGPPILKGILDKLNLQDKTFELKHKDPEGNERIIKVTYHDQTRFIRDMNQAKAEDFSNGEEIHVVGPIDPETMTMVAHLVAFGKFERPGQPGPGDPGRGGPPVPVDGIQGIVTEINHSQMTFKLKINEEITLEVKYFEWTGFIKGRRFVSPEELKAETRITLFGPVNREDKSVKAHYVVW